MRVKTIEEMIEGFDYEINGALTFAGATYENWEYVSRKWRAASTRENCMNDYNRRIFPLFQGKDVYQYTQDERDRILDFIQVQGNYSESTRAHYKNLIDYVFESVHNVNGSTRSISEGYVESKKAEDPAVTMEKARLKVVKYYTAEQEVSMVERFYSNPMAAGQEAGIHAMYELGTRNNETVALNFNSFRLKNGIPVVDILNSAVGDMEPLKPGTKTCNGSRTIQINERYYEHVQKRKAKLQTLVDSGEIVFPPDGNVRSVGEMPFVCVGEKWLQRATPRDLSEAGKKLFTDLGMTADQLREIYHDMEDHQDDEIFGKFKDPTSYTNRRNHTNHLADVGYGLDEIRSEVGHGFENTNVSRSFFVNNDTLEKLHELKEHRALIGKYYRETRVYCMDDDSFILNNIHGGVIKIPTTGRKGQKLRLTIQSRQSIVPAGLAIKIESDTDTKMRAVYQQKRIHGEPRKLGDPPVLVNVIYDYWEPYRKAEILRNKKSTEREANQPKE